MSKFDKWSHVLILVISTAHPEDNELSSPESEEEDEQPMTSFPTSVCIESYCSLCVSSSYLFCLRSSLSVPSHPHLHTNFILTVFRNDVHWVHSPITICSMQLLLTANMDNLTIAHLLTMDIDMGDLNLLLHVAAHHRVLLCHRHLLGTHH